MQIRILSQQSAPDRNERVVTHLNVSARIRSYQIGDPNRGDRTQTQGGGVLSDRSILSLQIGSLKVDQS